MVEREKENEIVMGMKREYVNKVLIPSLLIVYLKKIYYFIFKQQYICE